MASRFMKSAAKGVGKRGLDLPMAALAALSAGFVVFSLPEDLLEQLVAATGIGSVVAAAQPPLGNTARIGLSAAAAAVAFALVYLVLRLIDRKPVEREPEDVEEPVAPRRRLIVESPPELEEQPLGLRLRRSDAHPDAPARRPIFAMSDFGEPEPDKSPLLSKPEKKGNAPAAPFWEPEDFPAAEPEEAEAWMLQQEEQDRQPQEPPAAPPAPPAPKPEAEPEAVQAPQPEPEPEPEPESAPSPAAREPVRQNESIAELMARLERGLSKRQENNPVEPEAPAQPSPAAFASPGDDRLKSAIDHLQRIASRGH